MTSIPLSHVEDSQSLLADGEVYLYQLYPVSGGTVYFKNDDTVEWQDETYEGLPVAISGEKQSADTSTPTPRMVIGQDNVDLLPFKGLVHDGYLEGGRIVRFKVLLNDIIEDNNVKSSTTFRIQRVESYSRTKISLILATHSGAVNQTFPHRQYVPPSFPWVKI